MYHTKTHALVAIHEIAEVLARRRDRYPLAVAEFVQTAVHAKVGFPVLAIGGTTCHCTQQVRVDLDDLLHRAGGYESRLMRGEELR